MTTVLLRHWPAPWLTDDGLARDIVIRALCDVGIEEDPPGSNRGPQIDRYCSAVGSPLGSYWCAAALSEWFRDAGAAIPPQDAGSCQAWLDWAREQRLTTLTPVPGCAVMYLDASGHAHHCGVVVRATPEVFTMEGNTSRQPSDRNGVAALVKALSPGSVVYVLPTLSLVPTL